MDIGRNVKFIDGDFVEINDLASINFDRCARVSGQVAADKDKRLYAWFRFLDNQESKEYGVHRLSLLDDLS